MAHPGRNASPAKYPEPVADIFRDDKNEHGAQASAIGTQCADLLIDVLRSLVAETQI